MSDFVVISWQHVGYAAGLSYVFSQRSLGLTMLIFVLMVLVAAVNAYTMETRRHLSTIALFFFTLLFVLIIIIVPVGKLILSLKPWFLPQYIIPFGGMAIGNAMTAGILAQNTLRRLLKAEQSIVETKLALGAGCFTSAYPQLVASVKTGLVPTINTMMVVGLVHIPGIFGGVVLAGVSPVEATKYQIVVMYMLAMGASLTTFIVSWATLNSLFTSRAQLRAEELG
ncbi:MAG: hypothetical protein B1H03_03775 [Planctomycetales bacterium 4484_113]|nr:MAG: hypothetical protein B1H03_03775 [Planctomycetales bacterium 4484_113]